VLSARVPLEVYEAIKTAARKAGRTASEELVFRARQTFPTIASVPSGHFIGSDGTVSPNPDMDARARTLISGERQVGDAPISADIELENVRRAMRLVGFTQLRDFMGAYWVEPLESAVPLQESFTRMKTVLTEIIGEALAKAREGKA
jgi:hypothetical protein